MLLASDTEATQIVNHDLCTFDSCETHLLAQSNSKDREQWNSNMAVQWWSLTGPGLVSEALAGEIEHKEGEIQENSIDPRRCRADPRRKGAWCKTGFAGNWIHEMVVW